MKVTIESLVQEACNYGRETEKVANVAIPNETEKLIGCLEKVASLPCAPEAHSNVCELIKVASDTLRSSVSELQKMKDEVARLTKTATIRSMIDGMLELGIIDRPAVFEKAAELMKKDERGLEIVKAAMDMGTATSKNIFDASAEDNMTKTASSSEKRGIFDMVLGSDGSSL